jgi:hypothetical protein
MGVMTMSTIFVSDQRRTLSLCLAAAALSGFIGLSVNSDRLVASGFARVMSADPTVAKLRVPGALNVAGSEDFWLKQAAVDAHGASALQSVVWSKPLGVGDMFFVGSGATRKDMKVVAVAERSPNVTRIEVGVITAKQLWVQARDEAGGDLVTMRLDVQPALVAGRTL